MLSWDKQIIELNIFMSTNAGTLQSGYFNDAISYNCHHSNQGSKTAPLRSSQHSDDQNLFMLFNFFKIISIKSSWLCH